ncbi:uncharacterized lipoprotein YddW (UPF0748 family) [Balneicella halophila]|uniref:Uncharacterized lipoprotein YddW (UPF0748 family) n=1 Tax=Balneicella halophila TaxID=1537566 RepID=A0A7L4URF5_BALHA|nr:family 10 glycosylhydrolase [Balneicella halophila]PVX52330.1 uncharacterized lipoprotein YddW (UPF0748 family) [Balneicella halophila]
MKRILGILIILSLVIGCKTTQPKPIHKKETKHEMRALWVASVLNLDFPSKNDLSVQQQKQEFVNLLDTMVKYRFNTVVVQIRPSGDALYSSPFEPWSEVLTGTQGLPPQPFYDPLAFMIEESHKRNIDFHAWLNPYRGVFNYKQAKVSNNHPIFKHPEWFVNYGQHTYYNPGLPETREFIAKIVGDITRRYDIDAIHMDDYFYPYKIPNHEFPDEKAFQKYPRGFSKAQKDDWRRDNVNLIIQELRDTIKQAKPWVQFGISPFGVWRNDDKDPKGSETRAGQTNYDDLYADILLWMEKGWIDYVTPQIYWHIGHPAADYATLVEWWNKNTKNTHLYIGHALYKIGHGGNYLEWNTGNEITRQMKLNEKYPKVNGSMFFRSKIFETEHLNGLKDSVQNDYYSKIALPPPTKIQTLNPPPVAKIEKVKANAYKLSWEALKGEGADELKYYLIYMFEGKNTVGNLDDSKNIFRITKKTEILLPKTSRKKRKKRTFVITRVNKANQESKISNLIYKKL